MTELVESLSSAEIETVKRSLRAAVEGSFFPEWEFETLFGVDRKTVQIVLQAFPRQTVEPDDFICSVFNSLNHLLGYPHGRNSELAMYVPEGLDAIRIALGKLRDWERS